MVDIRRISTDDPLYPQERALREDVLLAPLGLDLHRFDREFAISEPDAEHYVAVIAHPSGPRVVGCAMLLPREPDDHAARIAQVAVDRQRQGEGIGRRLIATIESRAFGELGLTELRCDAKAAAVGFFEALGWTVGSGQFTQAGIPHQRMVLRANPPAAGGTGPTSAA